MFWWKRTGRTSERLEAAMSTCQTLPRLPDKQIGDLHWRSSLAQLQVTQEMIQRASWQQTHAAIDFSHATRPLSIICVSDLHYAAWSTDHDTIIRLLDDIIRTPDLYMVCVGDFEHMSINPRGVAEFSEQMVPPIIQHAITESIIEDLAPKILFSTWDNHSVERQEKGSGVSEYARLMSRHAVYFNGIGHADVTVGRETYRLTASHRFRGSTGLNPTRGQEQYMLTQAADREIAIGGDVHTPAIKDYVNGPIHRLAVNVGTAQTHSPYAQRHFSLFSHPVFPVVVLDPDEHLFSGLWGLRHLQSLRK